MQAIVGCSLLNSICGGKHKQVSNVAVYIGASNCGVFVVVVGMWW